MLNLEEAGAPRRSVKLAFNVFHPTLLLLCRGYIAPERMDSTKITIYSDIFSLGVVILKILFGGRLDVFSRIHMDLHVEAVRTLSPDFYSRKMSILIT